MKAIKKETQLSPVSDAINISLNYCHVLPTYATAHFCRKSFDSKKLPGFGGATTATRKTRFRIYPPIIIPYICIYPIYTYILIFYNFVVAVVAVVV